MTPARVLTAVLVAVVSFTVAWVALDAWVGRGGEAPPLHWSAVVGTLALVAVVLAAGRPVRNWVGGQRTRALDPLVAARTAVLAKAGVYGGAALAGWYAAQAVLVLPDLVGARRARFVLALLATLAAVAVGVAGFVVQRWCRIPPDDHSGEDQPD